SRRGRASNRRGALGAALREGTLGPRPVHRRIGALLVVLVEPGEDLVAADDREGGIRLEERHLGLVEAREELVAAAGLGRHLPEEDVEAELGQPLADALRAAAPLGLPERQHAATRSITRWRRWCTSWATGSSAGLPLIPSMRIGSIAKIVVSPSWTATTTLQGRSAPSSISVSRARCASGGLQAPRMT